MENLTDDQHIEVVKEKLDQYEIIEKLNQYLIDLKDKWNIESPKNKGWFSISKDYLLKGTIFIINSIDRTIQFVQKIIPNGEDKKNSVMSIAGNLFDYIIYPVFPIYLKPLAVVIKKILIDVIVNQLVEFIVSKYHSNSWKGTSDGQEVEKL